ncbi:hypothetical protein PC9H_002741 [Pleurotus ostreatus]|uniref:G domain-containing protein n=2 Tax=Pleurotus TaxID=5320 RepID=A0A8H7DNK7_PLEOS|nr:uncharacterized protein PC9H_002741 [Pleurotus ostreatus]KAF7416475.1 hypothetical protein PC9H_002741 [Pleurotus ostreatus]KAG9225269.1 hypothetical protein CCMSSC00406_0009947 [Pleurotus cornucopiae]KAJ8689395.1 hypothetical protein PTI98_013418 [Pleurotus ostreatus]
MANFELDNISADDIVIALMGATGSGKSQFINTATKTNCMGVGHTLRSHTSSIQTIRVPLPNDSRNRSVVFVDTPSFNNTAARDSDGDADGELSDERVLEMLAEWLGRSYQNSIKLSGIIYTHRITDNRMAGSPLRNLHLFEQLVGVDAIPNVVLATTMWAPNPSAAQQSLSENREAQLVQRYWKAMLDQGSRTMRYRGTYESAWSIVDEFLAHSTPRKLLLQRELIDEKKPLHQTRAGMALQDVRWIVSDYRATDKHHRRLRVFERMLAVSV